MDFSLIMTVDYVAVSYKICCAICSTVKPLCQIKTVYFNYFTFYLVIFNSCFLFLFFFYYFYIRRLYQFSVVFGNVFKFCNEREKSFL